MSSTSRLSSLLVRDGVVGVKRMEQAFQRQVIYGGGLDTILLEMNALPEERLVSYISLASGLPAADHAMLGLIDPRAVQFCPRTVAEEFHVAPVAFAGQALRVLVTDPVDLGRLEAMATRLGSLVQPFVVPEYRFYLILERLFGIPTPSRFAALASKRAAALAATRAPAVEPKVVVEDPEIKAVVQGTSTRQTARISVDAIAQEAERRQARRTGKHPVAVAEEAPAADEAPVAQLPPAPSPAAGSCRPRSPPRC